MAERGLLADCAERLNLTHPDDVRAVHRAYVEAGSRAVETNTLGASPIRLHAHGLEKDAARITEAAVGHVRAAGAEIVAVSMGTTAEFLAPVGELTFDAAVENFAVQARAAKQAGGDLIFSETLTDMAEARAMWLAAQAAGLPFSASFTFMENGRTLTGSTPEICALTAEAMGACMVGINCVGDPALLLSIVQAMRGACSLPIVAQPNAGLPDKVDGKLVYRMTPDDLLPTMAEAIRLGTSAIGGCCGTTPAHIRAMAALVQNVSAPTLPPAGPPRVCSLRTLLPLADALVDLEEMTPDAIDVPDAAAVMLDLRGASPDDADEAMDEALLLIHKPMLFRADSAETLARALRRYPGVAAYDAPFDAGFGAIRL